MTFKQRSTEIGSNRKGGLLLHGLLVLLATIFTTLFLSSVLMYVCDSSFFSVEGTRVPSENEIWVGLLLCFPGLGLAFCDLRKYLDLFKVQGQHHEDWAVAMLVIVFFEWIDNMDGQGGGSRTYSLLGFIVFGVMITQISIHYMRDGTGLILGAFFGSAKVLIKYKFQEERTVVFSQWVLIYFLVFTSFICMVTEGSATAQAGNIAQVPRRGRNGDDHNAAGRSQSQSTETALPRETVDGSLRRRDLSTLNMKLDRSSLI